MRIKLYAMLGWLTLCSIMYGAQKVPVQDFSRDKTPEEVLGNVSITRQELLYDINGIKIKKPKNPLLQYFRQS